MEELNYFLIYFPVVHFHPSFWIGYRCPAKFFVQFVCIRGRQDPSTQALKFRVFHNNLNKPLRQSASSEFWQHIYIAQVSDCREIGYGSRKANLSFSGIESEIQRILYRIFNRINWNIGTPVRLGG